MGNYFLSGAGTSFSGDFAATGFAAVGTVAGASFSGVLAAVAFTVVGAGTGASSFFSSGILKKFFMLFSVPKATFLVPQILQV